LNLTELKIKWFPYIIVAICTYLVICGIELYRQTFISWTIILTAIFITLLISTLFSLFLFNGRETRIGIVLMNVIIVVPITYYLLLKLNFNSTDNKQEVKTFKILKKSEFYKRNKTNRDQTINIDFFGLNKLLVFSPEEKEIIFNSDSITIFYRKGLIGFYKLENYEFE